jgi:hypothetical protein
MNTQAHDISLLRSKRASRPFLDKFDLICVLALLFSFLLVSRLPTTPAKYGDMYFHQEAQTLARSFYGVYSWKQVTVVRAPGPVLYYAVPYVFVRPTASEETYWRAALIWNALWMSIAVLLIRRTASYLLDADAGKFAAILALMVPLAVYYSFGVAAEAPTYVSAVFFLYGWARWRQELRFRFASGAFIAMAGLISLTLFRPNVLVVLGIAALCAFARWIRHSKRGVADAKFAIFCIVVGFATAVAVSVLVKNLPANRAAASNMQDANLSDVLFFGSFQFRTEPWDWRYWGKANRAGSLDYQDWVDTRNDLIQTSTKSGQPLSRLQMKWAIHDIVHHPIERLQMFAVRTLALNVWIANSTQPATFHLGPLKGKTVYLLFHLLLNAIALTPLFLAIWYLATNRADFFGYWPLWGIWIALLLFHGFTYAEPRYMLAGQPGLAILGGCALSVRLKRWKAAKS